MLPADYLANCAGVIVTVEAFGLVCAANTRAAMIVAPEYAHIRVADPGGAVVHSSCISSIIHFNDHAPYCDDRPRRPGTRTANNGVGSSVPKRLKPLFRAGAPESGGSAAKSASSRGT